MSIRILIPTILVLGLLSGLLSAEEGLLARLESETRTLAAKADESVVILGVGEAALNAQVALAWAVRANWLAGAQKQDPHLAAPRLLSAWSAYGRQAPKVAAGVLVGSPPRIVTTVRAIGDNKQVKFRLSDGTQGTATRALLDKDLGLAVYDLPHEVKMTRKILEPDPARNLARGRFGVVSGGGGDASRRPLGLALSRGSDTLGGLHYLDGVEGLPAGLPLVGSGGRLLGISYAQAAQNKAVANYSCVQCHQVSEPWLGDVTAHFKVANSAYSALLLQSFVKKGAYERAHGYFRTAHPTWTGTVARPGAFLPGWVIARVLDDLREHGRVQHSYLGVILGQTAGRGENLGVQIVSVLKDSPAARAGLKAGDRVRALDGERCHDPALLGRALVLKRPGENVRLGIVGKQEVVEVQLGNRSAAKHSLLTTGSLGLQCVELGEDLRGFLKLGADTRGVVVREVHAGSVAAKAGVQRGDVITEAGGGPVADLEELEAAVAGSEGVVFLKYLRGKETLGVSLKLPTGRNEKAR